MWQNGSIASWGLIKGNKCTDKTFAANTMACMVATTIHIKEKYIFAFFGLSS